MASKTWLLGWICLAILAVVTFPARPALGAGACCFDEFESCTVLSATDCNMSGGRFAGENTDCADCLFGLEDLNDTPDDVVNSSADGDANNDGPVNPFQFDNVPGDFEFDGAGLPFCDELRACGIDCGICGTATMMATAAGIVTMGRIRRPRPRR